MLGRPHTYTFTFCRRAKATSRREQLVIKAHSLLGSHPLTAFKWILHQCAGKHLSAPGQREHGLPRPFIFQSLFHYSCCAYILSRLGYPLRSPLPLPTHICTDTHTNTRSLHRSSHDLIDFIYKTALHSKQISTIPAHNNNEC